MLNFHHMVPLAAKAAGDTPILAAPYALPAVVCCDLTTAGLIGGYLAEVEPWGTEARSSGGRLVGEPR